MHSLSYIVLVSTCLATAGTASNGNFTEIMSGLPSCATGCLVSAMSGLPDFPDNASSICSSVTASASLTSCVQGRCNSTELAEVYEQLCNGVTTKGRVSAAAIIGLVCVPLCLLAIALRFYSRCAIARCIALDDWIIIAAVPFLTALLVVEIVESWKYGIGRHVWEIGLSRLAYTLKLVYVDEILYMLVTALIKSSILVFYLRVFASKWFWTVDLVIIALVVAASTSITVAVIVQCIPINGIWDLTLHAKCLNVNVLAFAQGGISLALDIVVLILPIPVCLSLQMDTRKKIHVIAMFSVGVLACIASVVRLHYYLNFGRSTDQTWDYADVVIWSVIEVCVATICACLPAIRILLAIWLPRWFETASFDSPTSSRAEKRGGSPDLPVFNSYNTRQVKTPDDEFLESFRDSGVFGKGDGEEGSTIWVNPRFDGAGNVVGSQSSVAGSRLSASTYTTRSSFRWSQGPSNRNRRTLERARKRKSREEDLQVENDDYNMSWGLYRVAEHRNPRLQKLYGAKTLPPLPKAPEHARIDKRTKIQIGSPPPRIEVQHSGPGFIIDMMGGPEPSPPVPFHPLAPSRQTSVRVGTAVSEQASTVETRSALDSRMSLTSNRSLSNYARSFRESLCSITSVNAPPVPPIPKKNQGEL